MRFWPVVLPALGAIILFGNIPPRLAKAEETISDLKDWAAEIQGYARAQNEMNQQIRIQQAPPRIDRSWDEQERRYYCDDGTQLWWADDNGRCE